MSLLNPATAYRRSTDRPRIPVVLPLVRVEVDDAGSLEVYVDDVPYEPTAALPDGEPVFTRADLRTVLDDIALQTDSAVRVEVHEPDGTVFTDFHTHRPSQPLASEAAVAPADSSTSGPARETRRPAPVVAITSDGLVGSGFDPGEEVLIAVVIRRHRADHDGTVTLGLPAALLERHHSDLLLLGAESGAASIAEDQSVAESSAS